MLERVITGLTTLRRSSNIYRTNPTGKKAPRKKEDVPKPTELMKAREIPLELDKNLNKTMIVSAGTKGAGQPGFYCDVCNKTSKDSVGYMDHINGRARQSIALPLAQEHTDIATNQIYESWDKRLELFDRPSTTFARKSPTSAPKPPPRPNRSSTTLTNAYARSRRSRPPGNSSRRNRKRGRSSRTPPS